MGWELSSVEQSNPIKAIIGPPIAELGARACWDDLIENIFEGFVQSWGSVRPCMLMSVYCVFLLCMSVYMWVIDKQRHNNLTSLGSVARFPLLTSCSRMAEWRSSTIRKQLFPVSGLQTELICRKAAHTQQQPVNPADALIINCLFGYPFANLTWNFYLNDILNSWEDPPAPTGGGFDWSNIRLLRSFI